MAIPERTLDTGLDWFKRGIYLTCGLSYDSVTWTMRNTLDRKGLLVGNLNKLHPLVGPSVRIIQEAHVDFLMVAA